MASPAGPAAGRVQFAASASATVAAAATAAVASCCFNALARRRQRQRRAWLPEGQERPSFPPGMEEERQHKQLRTTDEGLLLSHSLAFLLACSNNYVYIRVSASDRASSVMLEMRRAPSLPMPCGGGGRRRQVYTTPGAIYPCLGLYSASLGWSTGLALGKPRQG